MRAAARSQARIDPDVWAYESCNITFVEVFSRHNATFSVLAYFRTAITTGARATDSHIWVKVEDIQNSLPEDVE